MKMWNQTFRSDGRGVDKADDMEQIIVYAQRGRESDRIKAAIKRAAKIGEGKTPSAPTKKPRSH